MCNVEDHGEDVTAAVERARIEGDIRPLDEHDPERSRKVSVRCSKGHRLVFEVSGG